MLLCQNCSKSWGSSGTVQSDECRATVSFHFYSAKTTALCPSLPLKHPTGLLTFFLTNHEIFLFFWSGLLCQSSCFRCMQHALYGRDTSQEQGRGTLWNLWQNACGSDKASEGPFPPAAPLSCSICFSATRHKVPQSKGVSAPFAEPKPTKTLEKRVGRGRSEVQQQYSLLVQFCCTAE